MFINWYDLDRSANSFDRLRRQMDRILDEAAGARVPKSNDAALYDNEEELVLQVLLPGVKKQDIELSLHDNVLSLKATRTVSVPEGFEAQRRQRGERTVQRTVTLPLAVDAERTRADLSDGVLLVRMAKAEEARPRRIAVNG